METNKMADRETMIIRQSQVSAIIEYCKLIDVKLPIEDVIKISVVTEQYIKYGLNDTLKKSLKAVDAHIRAFQQEEVELLTEKK